MPSFELTSPDGKKYRVEGPEGATPEQAYGILQKQLGAQSGSTRGGDLLSGLGHGVASSLGYGGPEPDQETGWRATGEGIGGAIIPTVAGALAPESIPIRGAIGAATGFARPAKTWGEKFGNAALGGGTAMTGGIPVSRMAKSAFDHLAEMAIGSSAGYASHLPFGVLGGAGLGRFAGRELEKVGISPSNLMSLIMNNPGLAAYLSIKAKPIGEKAGEIVGKELGKPSQ